MQLGKAEELLSMRPTFSNEDLDTGRTSRYVPLFLSPLPPQLSMYCLMTKQLISFLLEAVASLVMYLLESISVLGYPK